MATKKPLEFLSQILQVLDMEADCSFTVMPVGNLIAAHHPKHNPAHALLVSDIASSDELDLLLPVFLQVFQESHPVKLIFLQSSGLPEIKHVLIKDLADNFPLQKYEYVFLFVPPLEKESSFEEFQEIIAQLRAPNGCPWDREQTHLSLRNNLLEEDV